MKINIELRKKNIALFGSCIARDPFTTFFNEDYKKYFNVEISEQRQSIISVMQEKNNVDISLLKLNPPNNFQTRCLDSDLNKKFLNIMEKTVIDYLIIDVHFEVVLGILCYNGDKIITNDNYIRKTKYFEQMHDLQEINFHNNPQKFFEIWKSYCNAFFEYMKNNYPNTKIILAEVRATDKVRKKDGTIYINKEYSINCKLNNPFYKKLESYIIENYDVYVIDIDEENLMCDENHRWGMFYVHYTKEYYHEFLKKVKDIVTYDTQKKLENQNKQILKDNKNLNKKINSLQIENEKLKKFKVDVLNSKRWKILTSIGKFNNF